MESFVVACDSRYYYSAGGASNNRSYYFDWSIMPEGKYEMMFSFISDSNQLSLNSQYSLYCNAINPINVYNASGTIGSRTIPFLGNATPHPINNGVGLANNIFTTNLTDNPPIICCRPNNNVFTIAINDGLAGTLIEFSDYVLTLYFKKINV